MATKKTTTKKADQKVSEKKVKNTEGVLEASLYTSEGKSKGNVSLPNEIFGLPWNADLVHQVVTSMMSNARDPWAHTKTRGEVRGGGKKPWKQKGTGRARHGSTRSPIWVGGGVAHGPRNDKNYTKKINKKMKIKALFTILSKKFKDGEILFVDSVSMTEPKTKEVKAFLTKLSTISGYEKISTKRTNAAIITVPNIDLNLKRSFSNMKNLELSEVRNINPVSLLQYKFVVLADPEVSLKALSDKLA